MSKFTRKVKTFAVWLFLVTVILLLISAGALFFLAQNYINNNLSEYVSEKTKGLYKLNFGEIELSFANQGFNISELELKPDPSKIESWQKNNPDKLVYSLSTPELRIEEINLLKLFKHKNLHVNKIAIVQPGFSVAGSAILNTDSAKVFDYAFNEFKQVFNSYINEIFIDKIEFIDAKYQFYNLIGDSAGISKAERISVEIDRFKVDSTLLERVSHPFEAGDVIIRMNNFNYEMGDSLHFMEIDSLEYSFTKSELSAFHINLKPKIHYSDKSLYEITVPRFVLRSESITDIYTSDSMKIQYLELNDPEITFFRKENPKRIDIEDIDNFDLYRLVENDLSQVRIDSFYLKNASLEIVRQKLDTAYQQKFENIDVHLDNFTLDPASNKNPNKLFYANDIEMTISGGYELRLDDGVHKFDADTIYVSTISNELGVVNMSITPIDALSKASTIINIGCKSIALHDVDLKEVYHSRILPVTNVEIHKPIVRMDNHTELKKGKGSSQAGLLFKLVNAYLNGVYSNLIFIQDGSLKISNLKYGRQIGYFETDFNFNLTDFSLDAESASNTEHVFYATNFDLDFSNYRMKLLDNLHQIRIKRIRASSHESKVLVDSLHLLPVQSNVTAETMKRYNRSELYNIFVPKITLFNSQIHQALFWNDLSISKIDIINPTIYFENFAALKQGKKKKEFSELYQLIVDYVDDISIKNVSVPSGDITWVNHSRSGKTITVENEFSIELINFRLNKNELGKKKILFSEHLNFSLKDQLFELSDKIHYLQAKQIDFSTVRSNIVFRDALLYPDITSPEYKNKPTTFQVTIPKLEFRGVNIVPAYFSGNIDVEKFIASNPKLEVYSQEGKTKPLEFKDIVIPLPPKVNSLKVGELNLTNGEVITYRTNGTNISQTSSFKLDLSAENILLDDKSTSNGADLYTDDILAKVNGFQYILKDKSHEIKAGELVFNKKERNILISDFKVVPSKYGIPRNQISLSIPTVELKGLDAKKAYTSNRYYFEAVEVNDPDIKIITANTEKKKKSKQLKDIYFYPFLEPYLDELKINALSLNNADVSLKGFPFEIEHKDIDVLLQGISIDEKNKGGEFLNSKSIEITTTNIGKADLSSKYKFNIDKFQYNSNGNKIGLYGLTLNPIRTDEEFARLAGTQIDVVRGSSKNVIISGVDVYKWIDEKVLNAEHLQIGPCKMDIFRNKRYPFNHNQKPPWPQELLQSIKTPFVVDSVTLLPSSITYSELLETVDEPASIKFTNLTLGIGKVSNMDAEQKVNPVLVVNTSANVNGKAKLAATLSFFLHNPDYTHTVSGSLQPVNMNVFNNLTEKAAFVTVEDGYLSRFDFNMTLDKNKASGKIYMGYDNLKVALIEYNRGELRKVGLASLMANSLMVSSKNPRGKTFDPEIIEYKRDSSRSVINYWWKSIFDGAKKALGIKKKNEKK